MSALDYLKKLNIMIGLPSNGLWHANFGMSLCNMLMYFAAVKVGNYREQTARTVQIKGSILPRARAKMVQQMLEQKCTHLLFVDVDQVFPRETLHEMILADKDVIAANIATKQIPASPTARKICEGDPRGDVIYTPGLEEITPENRFERVWRVGTGLMLIKRKVFEATGPDIFAINWKSDIQDYQGEDWSMCEAIEKAGFEIWIDHELSNSVGHIGDYTYTHEVVGEVVKKPLTKEKAA